MTKIQIRRIDTNNLLMEQNVLDSLVPVSVNDALKSQQMYSNIGIYTYLLIFHDSVKHLLSIPLNLPF